MGIVRMGPPENIILLLKEKCKISTFIETGTYKGSTAIWAAKNFNNVITIEYSKKLYDQVREKNKNYENINFLFGNSIEKLKEIVPKLDKSAIFWLDAHWSGGDTYGENTECPIIEELEIIVNGGIPHCIFIDDARLFLSPPPHPHDITYWPTISQILNVINSGNLDYYTIIFEDVIIAMPLQAKNVLIQHIRLLYVNNLEGYGSCSFKRGIKLMKQGLFMLFIAISNRIIKKD